MINKALISSALAAALSIAATPALACSTCKCGDPTITLLGMEKPYTNRFRIGLDYQIRSETEGDPAINEATTDEDRLTLGLMYSFNQRLTLMARIPYVWKEREDSTLATMEAEGLGDIDLIARYNLQPENNRRHIYGITGGLRLPTGEEVEDSNGNSLDIDVQPDANATSVTFGGYYQYFADPWFYSASINYVTYTDEGFQDFEPGDSIVGSLRAQYAWTYRIAGQFGLDYRHSGKDQFGGVTDDNSGGFLGNLWLGIAGRVGQELLLYAGAQIPVIEDLNGDQEEDTAIQIGLTYDFE
ncbi:MAG: hypothetical protein ACPHER_04585 [Nevskiales bacterium]